jgi:hypothetical protein
MMKIEDKNGSMGVWEYGSMGVWGIVVLHILSGTRIPKRRIEH